jgi:hypothetical protein
VADLLAFCKGDLLEPFYRSLTVNKDVYILSLYSIVV